MGSSEPGGITAHPSFSSLLQTNSLNPSTASAPIIALLCNAAATGLTLKRLKKNDQKKQHKHICDNYILVLDQFVMV